jgi:prepilin-type processing-associated H-X9-DG protein
VAAAGTYRSYPAFRHNSKRTNMLFVDGHVSGKYTYTSKFNSDWIPEE